MILLFASCLLERWVSSGGKSLISLGTTLRRIEASLIKAPFLMTLFNGVSPDTDPEPVICMFSEVDASYVRNWTRALS